MLQDLGATFGPIKVNIAAWRDMPVWADRDSCTVSMKRLPYSGATFPDARISEAGRVQLAQALSAVSRDQIEAVFRDAHFPEFQSGTDDERDLEAWVSAFRHRVDQIVNRSPCASPRISSISSITRFIVSIVWSSGSSVVMSTPASLSRSIGYFELPEPEERQIAGGRVGVAADDARGQRFGRGERRGVLEDVEVAVEVRDVAPLVRHVVVDDHGF